MAVRLSVNVNKVATLRNARGQNQPDVLKTALKIIGWGAQGITVHPRPDGRHILWEDVESLKKYISVELNVEGYPSETFLEKVGEIRPPQCTLVPDPPQALTSQEGWRWEGNEKILIPALEFLKKKGLRVSIFINPFQFSEGDLKAFQEWGVDAVELYTESYARAFSEKNQDHLLPTFQKWAQKAHLLGLRVHAGHDLNLENLGLFVKEVHPLQEVSIGHALVCDALDYGWEKTLELYLNALKNS